jgi:hypothetical protein
MSCPQRVPKANGEATRTIRPPVKQNLGLINVRVTFSPLLTQCVDRRKLRTQNELPKTLL